MRKFSEKTAVAVAKKELLNFTVDVLKEKAVISDQTFNQWRNIKSGSIFDGIHSMYGCWRYGLQWEWEYVQIPIKQTVIKIKAHRI